MPTGVIMAVEPLWSETTSPAVRVLGEDNENGLKTTTPKLKSRVKNGHRCFVDAIRGKARTPVPGELGRDAVALCDAIARAGDSGKFEKVKNVTKSAQVRRASEQV